MTKTYVTYDQNDLRSFDLAKLAALFNGRANAVMRTQNVYRNSMGDLFEILVNLDKKTIKAYALGGTLIVDWSTESPVNVLIDTLEQYARSWSLGWVRCSDCGKTMRRFSDDIAGRYMAGVYCVDDWPKYEAMKSREVD